MKPDSLNSATFIGGSPRSGTTLMHALLDGHPDLLVFPEEYLYLQPRQIPGEQTPSIPEALFKDKVVLRLQGKKNFLDELHEENRAYRFDYQRFEEGVNHYFRQARAQGDEDALKVLALEAILSGFSRSVGKEHYSRWVVKHPLYELHWKQLFSDFPNAKLLYMIRDPRDVILSRAIKKSRKHYLQQGGTLAEWKSKPVDLRPSMRFLQEWERSMLAYHEIRKAFPEHIRGVRYEDLVSCPQEIMAAVADFSGIAWNACLIVPTFLGLPWKGSSMQDISFSGVKPSAGRKKHAFSSTQLWQIDAWLAATMAADPGRYTPSALLKKTDILALVSRIPGESLQGFLGHRVRMIANRWAACHSDCCRP